MAEGHQDQYYYTRLDNTRVIRQLRYHFKDKAIIYGIRCHVTQMIYIGSTLAPALRFHSHLVTHEHSNLNLQADISKHGLGKFTVHIFEYVEFPVGSSYNEKMVILRKVEQQYIDRIPTKRLYNSINAKH